MLLAVPFALTGGVYLLWLLGYNFSVAVWVGFIALFGTAVQTGVVMVIYLEEAVERKRAGAGRPLTRAALRDAVIEGALLRLRPKVMTVSTVVAGLLPIMWSTRVGAEVMKPLATPVLGGMVSSLLHVLIVTPVIFFWIRERRLGLHQEDVPSQARSLCARRLALAVVACSPCSMIVGWRLARGAGIATGVQVNSGAVHRRPPHLPSFRHRLAASTAATSSRSSFRSTDGAFVDVGESGDGQYADARHGHARAIGVAPGSAGPLRSDSGVRDGRRLANVNGMERTGRTRFDKLRRSGAMTNNERTLLRWPVIVGGAAFFAAIGSAGTYLALDRAPDERQTRRVAASPVDETAAPAAAVSLSAETAKRAGLTVVTVESTRVGDVLRLPATVEPNAYKRVTVTPLVSGRVTRVMADLGAG